MRLNISAFFVSPNVSILANTEKMPLILELFMHPNAFFFVFSNNYFECIIILLSYMIST